MYVMEWIAYLNSLMALIFINLFQVMIIPFVSLGVLLLWSIVMFNVVLMAKKFIHQDSSAKNSSGKISSKKYNKLKNEK